MVDRSTFSIGSAKERSGIWKNYHLTRNTAFSPRVRGLRMDPFRKVKRRIKRLSAFNPPLYRLRIGDYRAYYRIVAERVVIIAILHKKEIDRWLRRFR